MTDTLVLYHAHCTDGAGSMWSAWKHLGDTVDYMAVGKQSKSNAKTLKKCAKAKKIYMCDMMLYYDQIVDLLDLGVEIVLLDHHVTNMNKILGERVMILPGALTGDDYTPFKYDWQTGDITYADDEDFKHNIPIDGIKSVSISALQNKYPGQLFDFCDMNKSGAGVTWDHFHATPRPSIIDYVEDFDLWRWSLPDGDSVHTYLSQFNWKNNKEIIKRFDEWSKLSPGQLAAMGKPLCDFKHQLIAKNMGQVGRAMVLGKYNVPILNANQFISETGNLMAKGEPFAVLWQVTSTGAVRVSLRSNDDGLDLPPIVAKLGVKGGGHVHAAGTAFDSIDHMKKQIKFL